VVRARDCGSDRGHLRDRSERGDIVVGERLPRRGARRRWHSAVTVMVLAIGAMAALTEPSTPPLKAESTITEATRHETEHGERGAQLGVLVFPAAR